LPLLECIRRGLRFQDADRGDALREKAITGLRALDPAIDTLLPYFLFLLSVPSQEHPLPADLPPAELRDRFEAALAAFFTLSARAAPLVIVLEDWHWADESSRAAVKHLVALIPSHPILLVLSSRPDAEAELPSSSVHSPIVLKTLNREEIAAMLKSALKAEQVPAGLVSLLHERCGGNPLFTEEVCRSLAESGALSIQEGRAVLRSMQEELAIPETVHAVIRARLDRLDPEARVALEVGSVIGPRFRQSVLVRLMPRAPWSAIRNRLMAQDILQQVQVVPEPQYVFKHVLTQAVAYDLLRRRRRRELHARVGEAIEELSASRLEEQYEELAYHFQRSDQAGKAVHYLELAGDKAARRFSLPEARRHFQDGIALLAPESADAEGRRTYISFALKWARAAQYAPSEDVLRVLQRAGMFAESLGDQALLAQSVYWTGRQFYSLGKMRDATPYFEQCIAMAEVLKEPEFLALPYNAIGRSCLLTGDTAKGIEYLELGLPMMEALGDTDEIAYSTAFLGFFYGSLGQFPKALALANRALEIAQQTGNQSRVATARNVLAAIRWTQGDWNGALEDAKQSEEIADRIGDILSGGFAKAIQGTCLAFLKDIPAGLSRLREGIKQIEHTGSRILLVAYRAQVAEVLAKTGAVQEAIGSANEAIRISRETGSRWGLHFAYRAVALAAMQQQPPDWDQAEQAVMESLRECEETSQLCQAAVAHFYWARILVKKGDLPSARTHLEEAARRFSEMGMAWWLDEARVLETQMDRS
jgi:tetratricopeptide (TPR) repeat protein